MGNLTFGDNVRVRATDETEAAGVAGLVGQIYGSTTPSITNVQVIGLLTDDSALNVHFKSIGQAHWFAAHLLAFVDHGAGTEIRLDGVDKKWTRAVDGRWIKETLAAKTRPWWRFW